MTVSTERVAIPMLDATDLQRARRRLYRVGDVYLPIPIAGLQAGVALGFALLWWPLLRMLGLHLGLTTTLPFLGPPIGIVLLLKDDLVEGRSPLAYAFARARWLLGTTTVVGR